MTVLGEDKMKTGDKRLKSIKVLRKLARVLGLRIKSFKDRASYIFIWEKNNKPAFQRTQAVDFLECWEMMSVDEVAHMLFNEIKAFVEDDGLGHWHVISNIFLRCKTLEEAMVKADLYDRGIQE